jgi:hypothetical protein
MMFARSCLLVALAVVMLSCESVPAVQTGGSRRGNAQRLPIEEIQADVMAFADTYTAVIAQASDRVAAAAPEHRTMMHDLKVRQVQNAITIAASANPAGALLDMTVMVTLQREVVETHWIPNVLGEAGQPILDGLRFLEEEVWQVARRCLDEQQIAALDDLIPAIKARYEGMVQVSAIRASDFSSERRAAVANIRGGTSLLQIFQLDPLAGLSPASRELAQTRMLAERTFFWAKRLPQLVNWQMQDVIHDALDHPDAQAMVASSERLTVASEQLATSVGELRTELTAEREAALRQFFDGVAAEREAVLRTFEQEDVRLRGLLADIDTALESGEALSASLNTTIQSFEQMTRVFAGDGDRTSDRRPFDILDYKVTAEALTVAAGELNTLTGSLHELLSSPEWAARHDQVGDATGRVQVTLEELIDRAYGRGLVLVGLLVIGGFVAAVAYRVVAVRLVGSGGSSNTG